MNETLMYFLKVNVAIALFYLFYRLFFAGDTFWKTRRYYMLFSVFISFVHPFLSVENWLDKQESVKTIVVNYAMLPEFTVTPVQQINWFSMENILMAIYALGALFLLSKMLVQLGAILRMKMQGRKYMVQGVSIIALEKEITPFSFFSAVFMNPALHNEHETSEILAHEMTHVRQWHSLDVLVSELLTIVFWFNPATWLLKGEIRQNLEFLADNKVIESGFDSKAYQYHLLQLTYQTPEIKLANKFNVSPLKKRIIMMNQKKSAKASLLKYSLIIPLALALVLSSNAQTIVNKAKKFVNSSNAIVTSEKKSIHQNNNSATKNPASNLNQKTIDKQKVYNEVDKMPEFNGGQQELMSYLAKNVKYPLEAQEAGIEGTVLVRFIVNNLGKVQQVEIAKSDLDTSNQLILTANKKSPDKDNSIVSVGTSNISPIGLALFEKEAIRVISASPDWIPGEKNKQKVSVMYTLPITFKLKNDSKSMAYRKSEYLSVNDFKNEKPLLVVDEKIVTEEEFSSIRTSDVIEINVLKDAAATNIWGDKGKSGVIAIKLKK